MREIKGNIWEYYEKGIPIAITTNGFVKKNGECAMGAGIAKDAKFIFPDLPKKLGDRIRRSGNNVYYFDEYNVFSFPTKHYFWQKSDIDLIKKSIMQLNTIMEHHKIDEVVLPKPGCSNGGLLWCDVKEEIKEILGEHIIIIDRS